MWKSVLERYMFNFNGFTMKISYDEQAQKARTTKKLDYLVLYLVVF